MSKVELCYNSKKKCVFHRLAAVSEPDERARGAHAGARSDGIELECPPMPRLREYYARLLDRPHFAEQVRRPTHLPEALGFPLPS